MIHNSKEETRRVAYVGKVPFTVCTLDEAVRIVLDLAAKKVPVPVRLSNAYCVALAERDSSYAKLFLGPGITFPDGAPVVWFMRRQLAANQAQRVRGPSLFVRTLHDGQPAKVKHFFLGTSDETLAKLVENVSRTAPDAHISGTYAPPFAQLNDAFVERCAERVNSSNADVVWVALGTPKQDILSARLATLTNRPCVGVGAAFDFSAGTVKEAPPWIQNSGFEWLFRLTQDPRRLWRRYLLGNLTFLKAALPASVKHK